VPIHVFLCPLPCVINSSDKLGVWVAAVQPLPQEVSKVVRLVLMTGEHRDHFLAQLHYERDVFGVLIARPWHKRQTSRQSRTKLLLILSHRSPEQHTRCHGQLCRRRAAWSTQLTHHYIWARSPGSLR
jgi:hypothetical protein